MDKDFVKKAEELEDKALGVLAVSEGFKSKTTSKEKPTPKPQ